MSAPWWGRERGLDAVPALQPPAPGQPKLHSARRGDIVRELLGRAAAYTPDWTDRRQGDAGYALARLFGELAEPVLERLNRLPEKTLVEFLRTAGIGPLPQQPSRVLLSFAAEAEAPAAVRVPRGTQLAVEAADGSGARIVFETERSLSAAPLSIVAAFRKTGGLFEEIDLEASLPEGAPAWRPFGPRPPVGATLVIGLAGRAPTGTSLAIGVLLAATGGAPPPVASGSSAAPAGLTALLKWEVLDGTAYENAAVVRDETRGLTQSGIIELRLPDRWRAGTPEGVDRPEPMFWLRVRLVHGEFAAAPAVQSLQLNAVEASAVQTIRDEVLEYVPGSDRRRLRLSQAPVIPGSLDLVVIEGGLDGDGEVSWAATDSLVRHGAADRVYVLDADVGELEFGDNVHGMRLPLGFRHVIARSYQVGGGLSGRVPAEAAFAPVQSIPFLTGVTNQRPASGGRDVESLSRTLRRGPEEIRTRGRAVTLADYELLARQAPGADVERAFAIGGRDARFPGAIVPGSVTVLLVSSDRAAAPPIPDAGTLEAASLWLTGQVAPAGIQVVTAAPRFQTIGVRATVAVGAGHDVGGAVDTALTNLQDYLHPLRGGDDGEGWPFGGILRHQALTRMLLERTPGLLAVPALNLVVDGVLHGRCEDWAIPETALIWPSGHEVFPVSGGDGS